MLGKREKDFEKSIQKGFISMAKYMLLKNKHIRYPFYLFVGMLLFKLACELGYSKILIRDAGTYKNCFDVFKYINGWIWCGILFWGIRHESKKVSSFMLNLVFLMQIIPITTIYAFGGGSAVYYNILCVSFFICELVAQHICIKGVSCLLRSKLLSFLMISVMVMSMLLLIVYIVRKNGMFTLTALNIYKVYELRSSGLFVLGKYAGYLFTWFLAAIIPFFIAKTLDDRNYGKVIFLCGIVAVAYLYSGYKGYLFALPVILVCGVWARRGNFYNEFYLSCMIGFLILVILACYSPVFKRFFEEVYSLFGRREMMVSANVKFAYYDFFSKNPKMGLGGILPRWLLNIPNPYENIRYTFLISKLYFGKPDMNANTGFLAEGYMRFGHIGTLLILILFAVLLRMMDRMQKREGYALTVGAFVYPVLALSDAHLIDTMFFGPWMFVLAFLLLYTRYPTLKISTVVLRKHKI